MRSILLIDDDNDDYLIFNDVLSTLPGEFTCTHEPDAEVALIRMCNKGYDLVFVDMNMPKINGIECTKRIRMFKGFGDVPIVIYSAFITDPMFEEAKRAGATYYIEKPYNLDELAKSLANLFSNLFDENRPKKIHQG